MKPNNKMYLIVIFLSIVVISSCAPGNEQFEAQPAGFWYGLWHGLICVITFIISLFSDSVHMFEVNNSGSWYDFGFLLGASLALSGSWGASKKSRSQKRSEKEWEEIGKKVEEKVKTGIKSWLDETEGKDEEWAEIGRKIEEKIKNELKKWANK